MAAGVGPGWDYYLDRMVVAEAGGDVAAVSFDDYHPVFADHYLAEFSWERAGRRISEATARMPAAFGW